MWDILDFTDDDDEEGTSSISYASVVVDADAKT